jgi:hypothetical protein
MQGWSGLSIFPTPQLPQHRIERIDEDRAELEWGRDSLIE